MLARVSVVSRIPWSTRMALLFGAIAVASMWAALAQQPQPFKSSKLKQASTTIQAISQSDRHLVLLGEDGQRLLVEAGPAVKNFDQVRPGDHVVVSYYEGLVAEVMPKGAVAQGTQGAAAKARTPAGDMPAGAVGSTVATTVQVESVDPSDHTITFKPSDGVSRTLTVVEPDARRFVGQLKAGDEVQIRYTEATAVSIEPARG
jgi:hypothetical protein